MLVTTSTDTTMCKLLPSQRWIPVLLRLTVSIATKMALLFASAADLHAGPATVTEGVKADADPSANGISISVLVAKSNKPIPEFRVIAGTKAGAVTKEFEERTGKEVVNWQPHTVRVGKDGKLDWPLERAYAEMALRFEADGYAPMKSS